MQYFHIAQNRYAPGKSYKTGGGAMLSSSFDISEFIKKVEGHSEQEIIYLADQEATAAERYLYKHRRCRDGEEDSDDCINVRQYALFLKDFVIYMRYGVLTRSVRKLDVVMPDWFERPC
jgi:hypothetical protein